MSGAKMTVFAGVVALLGAFATGAMAQSGANAQSTQTLEPMPVGTTTSNGAFLVSMNYCTVVMNTQCQVSVVTSAASPPAQATGSSAPAETTNPAIESVPIPTPFSMPGSAGPSTEAPASPETQSSYGSEVTKPATTGGQPSPTGVPAMSTSALTAAAAGIKAFPGAAWAAAILAIAVML